MMGYCEESKAYLPFDHVQWRMIIIRNVWFGEKYYGIKLLHASYRLLKDDPLDVVLDSGSDIHYLSPLAGKLNCVPVSTTPSSSESISPSISISIGLPSPLNETVTTYDRLAEIKNSSHISSLPR
jgi:hypothetical protein